MIVNRVPTLHRPLPPGASVAEICAYAQRRWPAYADAIPDVLDLAVAGAITYVGVLAGLSDDQIDAAYREVWR